MSSERLICNLMTLGQWDVLRGDIRAHLTRMGTALKSVRDRHKLDAVFSDAELAKCAKPHPHFAKLKDIDQSLVIPHLQDAACVPPSLWGGQ